MCCVFLLSACEKKPLSQNDFEFSVTINKTQYQIGENIEYQIQGGNTKAAIHPVLVRFNSINQIEEYINLFNNDWYNGEYCCNPNIEDATNVTCVVCNCELNTKEVHEPTESWNVSEYTVDDFYWSENPFQILILDPFMSSAGREESADCRFPEQFNIICESEPFYISSVSSNPNCVPPQSLNSNPSISSVDLNWDDVSVAEKYHLRYRPVGGSWTTITSYINNSEFSISELTPNTEYEWQVKTVCNYLETELSDWTNSAFFTTISSCDHPQSLNSNSSIFSVDLNWEDVSGADRYYLRWRPTPAGGSWTTITSFITNSEYSISELTPNTEYEWQVKTVCNIQQEELSDWTNSAFFTTEGPCQTVNCSSLSQLSDYEAYTLFGSSVTANWIISNNGYEGNCLYAEGNCTGGYIELTTNLSEPSIMRMWLRKGFGGWDWITYSVEVDGIDYPFSISQNSNSDSNWFTQMESNGPLPSGYNEIKIDFGQWGTTDNYYVDEIEFFCE